MQNLKLFWYCVQNTENQAYIHFNERYFYIFRMIIDCSLKKARIN
jgi:hypothetical protein